MHHLTARGRLAGLSTALFALVLLAAACGGDDGASGESFDQPDGAADDGGGDGNDDGGDAVEVREACDLLSTDDVEALLGQAVADGEQEDIGDDATECTWSTEEPSQAVDSPITLKVELGPLTDELSGQIDEALAEPANRALDIGDRSVLVCGLGADGSDCTSYDSIAVAVDESYLEVDLGNWGYPDDFSEDEGLQITEDATRQAVDALG